MGSGHIFDTHKAPFPAMNVRHNNEPVATDKIYTDVPEIDDWSIAAHLFCSTKTKFCDIYGVRIDCEFSQVLMDNICKRGETDIIISECDQAEVSNNVKVKDILCHLCIDDCQSVPHYKHQNNPTK